MGTKPEKVSKGLDVIDRAIFKGFAKRMPAIGADEVSLLTVLQKASNASFQYRGFLNHFCDHAVVVPQTLPGVAANEKAFEFLAALGNAQQGDKLYQEYIKRAEKKESSSTVKKSFSVGSKFLLPKFLEVAGSFGSASEVKVIVQEWSREWIANLTCLQAFKPAVASAANMIQMLAPNDDGQYEVFIITEVLRAKRIDFLAIKNGEVLGKINFVAPDVEVGGGLEAKWLSAGHVQISAEEAFVFAFNAQKVVWNEDGTFDHTKARTGFDTDGVLEAGGTGGRETSKSSVVANEEDPFDLMTYTEDSTAVGGIMGL
jgi:hypothetical protein